MYIATILYILQVFLSISFLVLDTSPIPETGTMIVSGRSDWPNKGEEKRRIEMRMMSICFTWVPISGSEEPNIYHDLGCFTRMWGFYLEGVWLWRISGSYFTLHFFYKIICILKYGMKKIWKMKKINYYIIVIVPPIAAWLPQL